MSKSENFVSRWWRLKRQSESRRKRETGLRDSAAPSSAAVTTAAGEDQAAGTEARAAPTFDPTSLPSIDSITAGTDIRIFLQSGVPAKLTEAALRRAWVSDPVIRDFIGIAENQWDFTNPTTIPGFGPLQETGDKLNLLAQAAGTLDNFSAPLPDTHASAEEPRSATGDSRRDEIENTARDTQAASATRAVDSEISSAGAENGRVEAAAQNNLFPGTTTARRCRHAHGGALPR